MHEWTASPRIARDDEIGTRATVVEPDHAPVAVHVPQPGKDPNRARRPPEGIAGLESAPVYWMPGGGSWIPPVGWVPGRAEAIADGGPEVLRRTPHMDLSMPALAPGDTFQVAVYVDTSAPREGEEEIEDVSVELPPGVDEVPVQVWLAVTEQFVVTGELVRVLWIKRSTYRSAAVTFNVRIKSEVKDSEMAAITAVFSYKGRGSGKVTRRVAIGPTAPAPAGPEPTVSPLAIDTSAAEPDLSVTVVATADAKRFRCRVETPHLKGGRDATPRRWPLPKDTREIVIELMEMFTEEGISDRRRMDRLNAAGVEFFKRSPKAFQRTFWKLLEGGKPLRTISIVSSEPNIPWELMVPTRLKDGVEEQRRPLGVEFAIGRWPDPSLRSPRQLRPIEDSYVIAPTYAGTRILKKATDEATFITQRFSGELMTPAVYDHIDATLRQRGTSLLHFVCHGEAGTGIAQVIRLDDPTETLNSVELSQMEGAKRACRSKQPLVFLNACEVGRPAPALVGVGGFGTVFVGLGAQCVIAPLWSVKDTIAHEVAVAFYEKVISEPATPFAEILRQIRARAYTPAGGEDTWAAYCFYGDPFTAAASA